MDTKKIAITLIVLCFTALIIGMARTFIHSGCPVSDKIISTDSKIAFIRLEGPIESGASSSGFMPPVYAAENVRKNLKKAYKDKSVKGVLLRINSPGGTVAMSQELYGLVMELRKKKPVVVSMGDVAASGGYYIAAAADRIVAYPGTLTGSIGVIFNSVEASSLTSKIGIKSQVIKSGKFKDIGSMYRPMSTDEKGLLTDIINDSYAQFIDAIEKGRIQRDDKYVVNKTVLNKKNLLTYADGRIFTGEQALNLGFVDQLGGLDAAHKAVNDILKSRRKLPLVPYNKSASFSEFFMNLSENVAPQDLTKTLMPQLPFSMRHSHKLLYVWE